MNTDNILVEEFIVKHIEDAANLLERLKVEELAPFFNNLDTELLVKLMREMDIYVAHKCLEKMDIAQSVKVIESLPIHLASLFLRRMQKEQKDLILENMEPHISKSLAQMLYHSVNTAGALMDPQVPTITVNLSAKEALTRFRKNKEQPYQYIFVLNQDRRLVGIVRLEDLVVAESKEQINSIMDKEFPHLLSEVEIKKVVDHPGWLVYNSLPVLDRSGVFLGALSYSVVRKTEIDKIGNVPKQAVLVGNALGELYRIGLSGLLYSTLVPKKAAE